MKKSGRKEETIHSRLRSCRAHKNFIRWVVLGVFLLCAVCIVYPFSPRNEQPAGSVKMVVLLPGEIDDQSWNTGNYKGIMACRKALDVELRYEKNVSEADSEAMLRWYADKGYQFILAAGTQFEEPVSAVADEYPEVDFCIINGRESSGMNVCGVYPKEDEASHLAAVMAGNLTESGTFGIIAGYPSEPMEELLDQYEKDVRSIAKKRGFQEPEVFRAYANSWEDVQMGKDIADQMIAKGADLLFIYANKVGLGCIESAKENGAKVIGFSENQNQLDSDTVVASVEFDFGAIYKWTVSQYLAGDLKGNKTYGIGIKEHIFKPVYSAAVPEEVRKKIEKEMRV